LLKSGFGYGDLGFAFRAEIAQQREERAVEHGYAPSRLERVLRASGVIGLVLSIGTAIMSYAWVEYADPGWLVAVPAMFIVATGCVGSCAGLAALLMLQRRRDVDTEVYARLWTGVVGRLLFGVAESLTFSKAPPASMTHRPTELSIGMAAEQLFATLPKSTRQHLRDLPDVVRTLEQDAQKMRRRLEDLQEALLASDGVRGATDAAGDSIDARRRRIIMDLEAERDLVQRRHGDALKALETIRLNLLRMHAGSGTVESLTTDLGLAREIAKEIGFLLEAEREIEEQLG
jgi:serine/threonine-protein kinase